VLDLEQASVEELDKLKTQYAALAEKARGGKASDGQVPEPS
jgi:hypothetical protein